jgi:hypothetical protein
MFSEPKGKRLHILRRQGFNFAFEYFEFGHAVILSAFAGCCKRWRKQGSGDAGQRLVVSGGCQLPVHGCSGLIGAGMGEDFGVGIEFLNLI